MRIKTSVSLLAIEQNIVLEGLESAYVREVIKLVYFESATNRNTKLFAISNKLKNIS